MHCELLSRVLHRGPKSLYSRGLRPDVSDSSARETSDVSAKVSSPVVIVRHYCLWLSSSAVMKLPKS